MSQSAVRFDVVPALPSHVRTIARRMRRADCEEVIASGGRSPRSALVTSLRKSACAWTWMINGRAEVMFGIADANILTGVGVLWLLGTDAVERHRYEFLRQSAYWVPQLQTRYKVLKNFVDARNTASVRWLRWLGATVSEPISINGYSFRLFELKRTD